MSNGYVYDGILDLKNAINQIKRVLLLFVSSCF